MRRITAPAMPISRSVGWKLSHGEENAAVKPSPIESSLPERSAPGASRKACASLSKGYTNRRYGRFSKNSFFINGIALALRETHKDDFFSVPEDNPLKEMLETAGEIVSQDSDTEQAYLAFICKRLKLNFRKLSVEERKWLKKIAEKSDLLKNPKPQRGRR